MKKYFGAVLVGLLGIFALPNAVDAKTITVGDQGDYTSLKEAVTAAESGDIISLTKDVTINSKKEIVEITGKEITIDGGEGVTITGYRDDTPKEEIGGNHSLITASVGAKIHLKNVTLIDSQKYGVQAHDGGYVSLDNVTINNCRYGAVLINAGTIEVINVKLGSNGETENNGIEVSKSIKLEGDDIDSLIRQMTYNQTNGIPQGSVLMDFIAEIVLGYADLLLTQKLNTEKITDYKIIRYRDDYRIFVNNTQNGNQIVKFLTEVMIELGFKLNATKTQKTEDVIEGSLKKDKLYRISHLEDLSRFCLNKGNLQKQLIRIYDFSKKFPNSGSLQSLLTEYNKNIKFKKDDKNVIPVISIAFAIAFNNPRVYPTIAAIIGKSLSYLSDFETRFNIVQKIKKKLEEKPNTEYMEIWLQRIIYNDDFFQDYNSKICQLVMDKNLSPLWNIDWVSNGLKSIVKNTPIVDYQILNNLDADIRDDEIDMFYYDD